MVSWKVIFGLVLVVFVSLFFLSFSEGAFSTTVTQVDYIISFSDPFVELIQRNEQPLPARSNTLAPLEYIEYSEQLLRFLFDPNKPQGFFSFPQPPSLSTTEDWFLEFIRSGEELHIYLFTVDARGTRSFTGTVLDGSERQELLGSFNLCLLHENIISSSEFTFAVAQSTSLPTSSSAASLSSVLSRSSVDTFQLNLRDLTLRYRAAEGTFSTSLRSSSNVLAFAKFEDDPTLCIAQQRRRANINPFSLSINVQNNEVTRGSVLSSSFINNLAGSTSQQFYQGGLSS